MNSTYRISKALTACHIRFLSRLLQSCSSQQHVDNANVTRPPCGFGAFVFTKERMKQKKKIQEKQQRSPLMSRARNHLPGAKQQPRHVRIGPALGTLQLTFPRGASSRAQADTCSRPCRLLNMCQGRPHLFCGRRLEARVLEARANGAVCGDILPSCWRNSSGKLSCHSRGSAPRQIRDSVIKMLNVCRQ